MTLPIIFYIATVILLAAFLSWIVRLFERMMIGVASEKWDAYVACFLSMIGITAATNLSYFGLYRVWWLYQVGRVLIVVVIFTVVFRLVLKHKPRPCVLLAIATATTLLGLLYGVTWLDIYL